MYAVHAFWARQWGLCLWAEDTDRPVKSPSQAIRSARPHPFAVDPERLADICPGKPGIAMLALPSLLSSPLDSPELVRVRPRRVPGRGPMLGCWSVPVLVLDPAAALALLNDPDATGREPDADLRYGASIGYLARLADFARELTERGRVLPTLLTDAKVDHGESDPGDGGRLLARWRPVLQGPDVIAQQALIAAMPPVCRAEAFAATELTGQSPTELVSDALHALVDATVRERLAGTDTSALEGAPRRGRRPKRIPAAEAWLAALSSADARFVAEPDEADRLRKTLAPWSDFGVGQTGPGRATFRLTELDQPQLDPPRPGWRLEFLLQSVEDPSLLVPAEQLWAGGDGLQRWIDRPDEVLLAELGRASTIYPALTRALRQATPTAMDLDAAGAYDFLAEHAGLLDQAGFGVLVPSWWSKRRTLGLTGSATPQQEGGVTEGMLNREALCDFRWRLAIGDEPLTPDELAALAAAKAPLVQLRGEWVAVDPEQVRRGLDFLQRQPDRADESGSEQLTVAEIIRLAASHPDDLDTPLPVTAVQADGWLGDLLSGVAEQTLKPLEVPSQLQATLRPYQQRGLSWLAFLSRLGLGACLADDMGLGKTIQLLALELLLRQQNPDTGPTLLVCPMSLVGNWQHEAERFAPSLRLYAHHGPGRLRGTDLDDQLAAVDVVVTTYQTATRDIDDLAERGWSRVVLDEAQAIKNNQSRSAKAVRRLQAGHRITLTGTPMENRLAELWSVMDFLNPGLLGSPEVFRSRYARPIERYGQSEPAERLRRVTRPYILRRLKTDKSIIDDLPDKIEIKQYCNLTTEQASLYQSVVDEMMPKIESSDGIARRGNVLATMTKLKQVCNHPAQLLHDGSALGRRSGKVLRLEEILDEIIAEGDKVLLFTQFTEFADLLLPHLAARFGRDVLYLHGKTSKPRRDELVRRFQDHPEDGVGPSIFLLSLKAGGVGLNLTAASHVIHLDRWWNPAVENQATDRAFRIGQRRNVQVRKFICTGTLEEKIDRMIEEKKALADLVVGDGESWLTELSTNQLREMFTLSQEAVGE